MRESSGFVVDLDRALEALAPGPFGTAALGVCDARTVGVARLTEATPWEVHPDGDELLVVLSGRVRISVLPDDGEAPAEHASASAGALVCVTRGRWHKQTPDPEVRLLFVTQAGSTRHSSAADPRRE